MKKKKLVLSKALIKKATKDIQELEDIWEIFVHSDRPDSLGEFKEANKMVKWFNRYYKKYTKKSIFNKLPSNLQRQLNNIEPDDVGEFD